MPKSITKREALALVSQYCRAMDLELSKEETDSIATYLQLQHKNLSANQTTLAGEDSDVMAALKKVKGENGDVV